MIIKETENAYDMHIEFQELEDDTPVVELTQENGAGIENTIGIDKQQATKLIEVLQKWVDGGEVE